MLRSIGEGLWAHEVDLRMPGGLPFPARATLLRLGDRTLALHSPLAIDEATARQIDALGRVRFLIAPNCRHWMHLQHAKERYPDARVLGAPGLEKKLGSLAFEPLPADGSVDGLDGLWVQRIEGAPRLAEHVLLHPASRSLVVADLVFNIHRSQSALLRLYLRLGRMYRRTAQSVVWRLLVNDRVAAARSAAAVLAWSFDRLIVAHGEVVEDGAHERIREALVWMLEGAPRLLPLTQR
jgi:hypothetical protein